MALLSGHIMPFLSRLIQHFLEHPGTPSWEHTDILDQVFIPIFSWGTCLQGCLGSSQHFSLGTLLHCIGGTLAQ